MVSRHLSQFKLIAIVRYMTLGFQVGDAKPVDDNRHIDNYQRLVQR